MGLLLDINFVRYGILITLFRLFCFGIKYQVRENDEVIVLSIGVWKCHANLELLLKGTAYA